MKHHPSEPWNALRAAGRPPVPDLDLAAIMDAVRREASAHPLPRIAPSPVMAIPTWACALAASLAILAAASVIGRSVTDADRQIGHAWMRSVQPGEFVQTFLPFEGSIL